ncbi:sensor histidine kinase [Anaerolentibacter hominis]|uniref:sensor histidine kinase n=1 Tax=Anaerolentibacter hominis TaxID=3079009 RepID=UPI0031B8AD49
MFGFISRIQLHPYRRSHMKLFFLFILTFLIPVIVIALIFSHLYYKTAQTNAVQAIQRETNQLAYSIETQLNVLNSYAILIGRDQDILKLCHRNQQPSPESAGLIQDAISRYSFAAGSLYPKVTILNKDNQVISGADYVGSLLENESFIRCLWSGTNVYNLDVVWLADAEFPDKAGENGPSSYYIVKAIVDPDTWEHLGLVVLSLQDHSLAKLYINAVEKHQCALVLSQEGAVLSSIDDTGLLSGMNGSDIVAALDSSNPVISKDNTILYRCSLNKSQWQFVLGTDLDSMMEGYIHTGILYSIAIVACIVISTGLAYVFSSRFMIPIRSLVNQMNRVKAGKLNSRVEITSNDEIGELARNYNDMLKRIQELILKVVEEQELKRKSDMLALQSQINPHFLYNTLASIRYTVYSDHPQDADVMILALTRILKNILSNTAPFNTIDMELAQLNNYITIQQYSFDTPIKVTIDLEEGLGDYQIIKLLLQPIVENSILHGLKTSTRPPELTITCRSTGARDILFTICDNGNGFDLSSVSFREQSSSHIGIDNVRKRLLLHYGPGYTLEIRSQVGEGTTVSLIIPKRKAVNDNEDTGS